MGVDHVRCLLSSWCKQVLALIALSFILVCSLVAFPFALLVMLLSALFSGGKNTVKLTHESVHQQAEALERWYVDALAKYPKASDCLSVGWQLAKELTELANQPHVSAEETSQFAQKVKQGLKTYKGPPFDTLRQLSRGLARLANDQSNA